MIWSALFTVGNFLYGRMGLALAALRRVRRERHSSSSRSSTGSGAGLPPRKTTAAG
ncbi:MAG: hypothetical protein MZU79_06295 [Anaerotruncus sp.]|nr:hypothetical protein [Anaerotruncus sp.]